jgi:hypothetical protein
MTTGMGHQHLAILFYFYFIIFETGSHYVAQAASNSPFLASASPSAGITDVFHLA